MEIYLLNASSKVGERQAADLLKLHYRYLDHQATLLKIKMSVPKLNARQLIEGNCIVLVYQDDVAVGYCSYRNRNGSLKIRSVYVLPDYRQRGVMKEIFKAIAAMRNVKKQKSISSDAAIRRFTHAIVSGSILAKHSKNNKALLAYLTMSVRNLRQES